MFTLGRRLVCLIVLALAAIPALAQSLGDVILDGTAPGYSTYGVFLRSNTTGAPNAGVKLGTTGTSPSSFTIFDSANYPLWQISNSGTATLSTDKSVAGIEINNTNPGSGSAAAWSQLKFMEGSTQKAYLLSVSSGSVNFGQGGANQFRVWNVANGPLTFATNNIERMRIDASGYVGIGTAAPLSPLHIIDVADGTMSFRAIHGVHVEANTTQDDYAVKSGAYGNVDNGALNQGSLFGVLTESLVVGPGTGTLSNTIGSRIVTGVSVSGTVTAAYGQQISIIKAPSGNINTGYGVWVDNIQATTGWAFYQAGTDDANHFAGDVLIGTTAPEAGVKLKVQGNVKVSGSITATTVIGAVYQDVAEWVPATTDMAPGTVVVLNPAGRNEVMAAASPYDTSVAGVVSVQPGLILGEAGATKEMIATTGRVRVRVDASRDPISVGDLLVTSGKSGVAMRSKAIDVGGIAIHRPGTIIGKALEPLERGEGEILVLLSLQ